MSNNKKTRPKQQTPKPEARSPKPPAAPDSPPVGTLPDLGDPAAEQSDVSSEPIAPLNAGTPTASVLSPQSSVLIEIPIGALSTTGYITGHVEVNHLSAKQKQGLNRLWNGLRESRETLQDRNREVNTPADAVRWLLEKYANAADQ